MPEPMGLTEFFAMEANDYLERLDTVVSKGAAPDREEFVRLARALRGSALMANQQAFAAAAGGLERLARAVRDRSRSWDPATKQVAVRAVDDLKVLVRKVRAWTDADAEKAEQIAGMLQSASGGTRPSGGVRAPAASERTFIAQQGSSLASALEQAAGALQQNPLAHNPLQAVLRTMQPLRGIASLADYPPLPELLDGIDRAIGELSRRKDPASGVSDLFRAAARAVSRAARDVASSGRPEQEGAEASEFARRLGSLLGLDQEILPIESLFYEDAGPHIIKEGTPPARPAKLGNLELVSHGEHLRQAADALERALSSVQRELRAHALVGTFHSLGSAGGGPLGQALQAFSQLARDAIARGQAVHDAKTFAHFVREAGTILAQAANDAEDALAQRLSALTTNMKTGAPARAAAPPPTPPPAATLRRPPAPSVATRKGPEEGGVPEDPERIPGLIGSYARHDRLVAALGLGNPSLDEILAGPAAVAAAASGAPAPDLRPGRPAPSVASTADVAPITTFCYSGEAAIERALGLRDQLRKALGSTAADGGAVDDLIEEIFDLVQLGTGRTR
jgi:chemotaxis protein histidine kinase CheA